MSTKGPIVIIEDDKDDQLIIQEILVNIGVKNRLIFFSDCTNVIPYLIATTEQPFLILSDINLPKMSGIELRRLIDKDDYLRRKSVPFVFFSTTADKAAVNEAYAMMVQGYFEKPSRIDKIESMLRTVIDYWTLCKHPNMYL